MIDPGELKRLIDEAREQRGILVCGPHEYQELRELGADLAAQVPTPWNPPPIIGVPVVVRDDAGPLHVEVPTPAPAWPVE